MMAFNRDLGKENQSRLTAGHAHASSLFRQDKGMNTVMQNCSPVRVNCIGGRSPVYCIVLHPHQGQGACGTRARMHLETLCSSYGQGAKGGSLPSPNPPPPLNKIGMRNRIQRRKEQANNRTEGGALLPIHFYTKGESECGRETQTALERAVCPRRPSGSQGGSRDLVEHSFHLSKWHSQFMLLTPLVNFAL